MKESHLEVEARPQEHEPPIRACTPEGVLRRAPEGTRATRAVDCLSRALATNGEGRTTLGTPVNDVCAGLALRDTFRALFAGELLGCRVGWPRLVSAGRSSEWLRDGDLLVELARSLPHEAFELGIVFPAAAAALLSDRLLGAPSSSGMASRVGTPSDAECGVLAYASARLAAAHGSEWLVRDVRPFFGRAPDSPLRPALVIADEMVLWPVVIDTTVGKLEVTLCLSASLASSLPAVELQGLLHENLGSDETPALAVGEVWVSDRLPLTHTSLGLTGPVTLRVPDCERLLPARLSEHYVSCTPESARPAPASHEVELVIVSRLVEFSALAAMASGARCFVGEVGREPVSVRRRGQTIARGELIVWRGALGVRITEV